MITYCAQALNVTAHLHRPKLRKLVGVKQISFASVDDVKALTGCIPGAVPPFGSLFEGVKTYVDRSIIDQGPNINFNAGLRTFSVLALSVSDYLAVEKPEIADFTS
jgi:Ala-tRNA(Pro) deacylase